MKPIKLSVYEKWQLVQKTEIFYDPFNLYSELHAFIGWWNNVKMLSK